MAEQDAEEATAQALGSLPNGGAWAVIHDVAPDRELATIDHAVVGPQGVFVIDSRDWPGRITVEGGVLRQDGSPLSSTMLSATTAAAEVAGLVPAHLRDHVRAVICLSGSEGPIALVGDVMVCSTSTLVTLLTTRPAVLSDKDVHTVAGLLRSRLGAAPEPRTHTGFLDRVLGVVTRKRDR